MDLQILLVRSRTTEPWDEVWRGFTSDRPARVILFSPPRALYWLCRRRSCNLRFSIRRVLLLEILTGTRLGTSEWWSRNRMRTFSLREVFILFSAEPGRGRRQ